MDEVRREFEQYVHELRASLRAGRAAGTDGEVATERADELIDEYRSKLKAEDEPSRGRQLIARFRDEAAKL